MQVLPKYILGFYLGSEVLTPDGLGVLYEVNNSDSRVGVKFTKHKFKNDGITYYNENEIRIVICSHRLLTETLNEMNLQDSTVPSVEQLSMLAKKGYDFFNLKDNYLYKNCIVYSA